jgi:transcriptional regulator GlxA family with amidase domain
MEKIVSFHEKDGREVLKLEEFTLSPVVENDVRLRVRAISLNRAESHRREGDPENTVKQVSALPKHILRRVIERMRNLDTELSLQVLAKESGYSRVHFARMFRAATGYTPHNYLLKLRVDRVRELLANPTLSLTDIALECGFSSHSHLSRVFRQILGATPSEYRRSLWRLIPSP